MQQELIKKKREIIDIFLKKGVLISSELLKEINDDEHVSRIFELLKTKNSGDFAVVGLDLNNLTNLVGAQTIKTTISPNAAQQQESKVKIVYSHKQDSKKREPQDFVDYFNNRYKAIEKILKQRQELKNIISISKLTNKK